MMGTRRTFPLSLSLALSLPMVAALAPACRLSPDGAPPARVEVAERAPQGEGSAAAKVGAAAPSAVAAVTRLGAALRGDVPAVALADVARAPARYEGRPFTTTGTVTAVCQHMGCWMEVRDDAAEAHVKMAGHAFSVPRSASGKRARVMGRLERVDEPEPACAQGGAHGGGAGCRAEAEAQMGRPLAKLALVAEGVELVD